MTYSLDFPEGYDDYAFEIQSKGWFAEARLSWSGRRYKLKFYDPVRLAQEIESELRRGHLFFEPNLVVVKTLTRSSMEEAANRLVEDGNATFLVAE